MPNHKFIRSMFDDVASVDDLLCSLYVPSYGYWVTDADAWAQIVELMAGPSDLFSVKAIADASGNNLSGFLFGHKGERLNVSIRSPQTLADWGLLEKSPEVQRGALARYESAFDVWISGKPSTTGLRLLEKLKGRPARPEDMTPFEHNDAFDFIWTRPLTEAERAMPYLHAFDKRTSYLYSSDIALGIGEYGHVAGSVQSGEASKQAGLYKVSFSETADTVRGLPFPALNRRGWYYTPMIALFVKLGLSFTITEAYVFPKSSRVLGDWVRAHVDVIKGLDSHDAIDGAVVKMAKRTFRMAIGLFGGLHRKDKSEWSYRPDWRGMIVSDASARIYYGMLKALELSGRTPAAIYCDCLYYPSAHRDPSAGLPFLSDERLRAGYHYEATYSIESGEAQALFESKRKLNFAENIQAYELGVSNG